MGKDYPKHTTGMGKDYPKHTTGMGKDYQNTQQKWVKIIKTRNWNG